jgi:DMSO/TMAO reductase YedYZ molybdopterin-dependent catalytic subunit
VTTSRTFRAGRALAGALTALLGLAVAQLVARAISTTDSPVEAVGTWIIRHAPGPLAERAIRAVGHADKPLLITGVVVVVTVVIAALATRRTLLPAFVAMGVFAIVGVLAIAAQPGAVGARPLSVAAGLLVWLTVLPSLAVLLPDPEDADPRTGESAWDASSRRSFLTRVGIGAGLGVAALAASRYVGAGRRKVQQARAALRLRGVTQPQVPVGADQHLPGQPGWMTPASEFYRIDTSLLPPAVDPDSWRLRIHGMVDHPVELSFADLQARRLTEDWITLCCVSNEVGGDLIGNAWWSGVRIAPLLAAAGVKPGADGVLQTSSDGWTCLTPLSALTDDRNAILALAMNGEPLPIEHGFPVRTVVPGLYGYVSATKWVVDFKVTTFAADEGYWTPLGWSAMGPIKIGSRIDVATDGGRVLAGSAWHQHTGIEAVQVSVDGGAWTAAELAREPSIDAWVQWRLELDLPAGSHHARVRAVGSDGEVQTGVVAPPAPNGASGWHSMDFQVG